MAVTRLEILSRQPFEDGAPFGAVGSYERVDGTIHFAVDPRDPANQGIVDLDRAEQYADGTVHFQAGFGLLQPADPSHANRRLLFDVLNRGDRTACVYLNRAPRPATPTDRIDPGDGFLMRHGWTIAWCGWQWDVPEAPGRTGLVAPQAVEGGRPIERQVMVSFQPNAAISNHPLADDHLGPHHEPYPAAGAEELEATLFVRDWTDGPRTVIDRGRWRFARDEQGRPIADDCFIWLEGGFQPGTIYEAVYRTRLCPVTGTGLLAVRDAVSFLRHADGRQGNPCAGRLDYFYGFGASQSGRFLRHFLYLGLNLDEQGRRVFDGVLPHVAGARRGEFNHRYAQPSVLGNPSFGHQAPFTDDEQIDPVTQQHDGLLRRQRARHGVPHVITTNTSTEYWRAFCSLIHTDPLDKHDIEPPDGARIYHFAGTQHLAGALPLNTVDTRNGVVGTHAFNVVDYTPLLRAALVNLDRWVAAGEEPPPSVFPRLGDGAPPAPRTSWQRSARFPAWPCPPRLGSASCAASTLATTRHVASAAIRPSTVSRIQPTFRRSIPTATTSEASGYPI